MFLVLHFVIELLLQNMDMAAESNDDSWHETYPRETYLLLTPSDQTGVMIHMTPETRLPHRYKSGKGETYIVYNDLTVTFNGNR